MAEEENEVSGFSEQEWEDFERSFTDESTRSAPHREPSARQRELTARWKREPPRDTGWRADAPEPERRPRELYPAVPYEPRRRKPGWQRNLVWILVMLLVVGAVLGLPTLFGSSPSRGERVAPAPGGGKAGTAGAAGAIGASGAAGTAGVANPAGTVLAAADPNADDESSDRGPAAGTRRGSAGPVAVAVPVL